jgi:hypothetical protein
MSRKYLITLVGVLLLGATAWAQDPGQEPPPPPTPAPAFGQEPTVPQVTQAPPVTSLDEASLEPAIAARSFLQPGVHVNESVNSNLGQGGTVAITRLLGSLDLTRLWSRYTFVASYIGGASLYSDSLGQPTQIHAMAAAQRYAWRTGQLQVRDSLTYLPEGSFGFSGFGGAGGSGSGGGVAGGGFGGGSSFGTLGQNPRLTNASSVTLAGGYTFTDFTDTTQPGTINSRQVSGQAGYSRVLNHFDQIGLEYGYQQFQFPIQNAGTIDSHTVQGLYEHQISGRMDLILGAGPQVVVIRTPTIIIPNPTPPPPQLITPANTATRISVSARASLRYRFPRDSVALNYNRHTTAGSGIQLGSQTDDLRFTYQHPLNRLWTSNLDVGYSYHSALQLAVNPRALGGTYQAAFGGGGLTRRLGRYFTMQLHYQYDYLSFSGKTNSGNRHVGDFTLSWRPNPIRLD